MVFSFGLTRISLTTPYDIIANERRFMITMVNLPFLTLCVSFLYFHGSTSKTPSNNPQVLNSQRYQVYRYSKFAEWRCFADSSKSNSTFNCCRIANIYIAWKKVQHFFMDSVLRTVKITIQALCQLLTALISSQITMATTLHTTMLRSSYCYHIL